MKTRFVVAAVVVLGSGAGTAFAGPHRPAPPPAPAPPAAPAIPSLSDTLTGDAKGDYESGKLLFLDGDYAGALLKFRNSYDKGRDPRLMWNIAACEKNLRHYARTLELVRDYRTKGAALLTDDDRKEADELIRAIEPLTARIKLKLNEPDATVTVDGEPVAKAAIDEGIRVDIGARKLVVTKEGFITHEETLVVGGAPEMPVEVTLKPVVHEGKLTVRGPVEYTVSIDGKAVGTGGWSGTLSVGTHQLRVTAPHKLPYASDVVVLDHQENAVDVGLVAEPVRGVPVWLWVTGGAVVAAGGAVAAIILAKPKDVSAPAGTLGIVQANVPFHW